MTTPRELAAALAAVTVIADAAKARKDELRGELLDALDEIGADSAKALLPDGTDVGKASLVAPESRPTVRDENAFTGYVAANRPTEVLMRVRESYQRAYLDSLVPGPDGSAVDPETGEIVPGVVFADRSPYVSMRFSKTGREDVIAAIRSGVLPLDLPNPTPRLESK